MDVVKFDVIDLYKIAALLFICVLIFIHCLEIFVLELLVTSK